MFKIIQRYLASSFVGPFLLSTTFFVAFLLTFQLFRLIRIMTSKGAEVQTVLELMAHISVSFLPMAVPLSVLFAVIYTMNKLSGDSEVVAMRSFGLKKGMLFMPFLILAIFIALVIFVLNQNIIPYSKTMFKNTVIQLTSRGMLSNIKAGQFFTEIPNVTLFAESVSGGGSILGDVFIRLDKRDEEQIILARRGTLIKQIQSKLRSPTLRLSLEDGNITKKMANSKDIEKILFKEYDFPVLTGGHLPGFVTKDSMRTNRELAEIIERRKKSLAALLSKEKLNDRERGRKRELEERLPKSQLEYWTRWNTPFQVILFMFLGFSLGIKKGRGRTRNSGSLGLIVLASYYALFFTGISVARKGGLPPNVAVFLPTVLVAFVATYFFRKIDWFN